MHLRQSGLSAIGSYLRLDQNWAMFAPAVFKDDGWYIYEAKLISGTTIDLNRNGVRVTFDKPENVLALQKNDRWRKYLENYLNIHHDSYRPCYCHYLIYNWNKNHPGEEIQTLKILYMKEYTKPFYQQIEPEKVVLQECSR